MRVTLNLPESEVKRQDRLSGELKNWSDTERRGAIPGRSGPIRTFRWMPRAVCGTSQLIGRQNQPAVVERPSTRGMSDKYGLFNGIDVEYLCQIPLTTVSPGLRFCQGTQNPWKLEFKIKPLAGLLIVTLALTAAAASAETPTGHDISEKVDQIGSDVELVVERDVVARMAELHFMTASLSIVPEEEVSATERETQRAAIEVADNCAAHFTKLVAIVGKEGETRAWLAAMPCFSKDGASKTLGQAKTHSQQQIDTSDYPMIFGNLSAGLKKVLVGYE